MKTNLSILMMLTLVLGLLGFSGAVEAHKKNRNESTIKIRTAGTALGQIQEGRLVFAYSSRLLNKNTRETHARTRPLDLEYLGECEEKVDPATGAVPFKLGHSSMEGNSTLIFKDGSTISMKLLGSDYYICYFDGGAESGTNSYYFPYQIIGGTERFEGAAGRVESSGEYQSLWSNSVGVANKFKGVIVIELD